MKKLTIGLWAMVLVFGAAGTANSALIDRGSGLIYDNTLNITWLQDANYAQTSGYDSDGRMDWDDAVAWADQLEYAGHSDWRLPTTVDGLWTYGYDGTTTAGYNITTSEMGHVYYETLGNLGYCDTVGVHPQPGWGLRNTSVFRNLQPDVYWSGTVHYAYRDVAWFFRSLDGRQSYTDWDDQCYAWAVIDGDVGAIPIPCTAWLLGSGLIGVVGLRRKLKK